MKRTTLAACGSLATIALAAGILEVPQTDRSKAGPPENGRPSIGGPFQLTDGDGRTVSKASFRGRWMLVYFGYTHCPDACPLALQNMVNALDRLDAAGRAGIVPVFITVDPARDTPAVMKDYISGFGTRIVALSGSPDAIGRAEAGYHVYAAKHPTGGGDYEMDHSSIIYIMDPRGRFVANFTHESDPQQIASKLKQLGA